MTKMTREQTRARTQQKLRDAALQEFAARGFYGTSIDRIADAAGFSRGAFYANYKNKHVLLLELLKEHSLREAEYWHTLIAQTHGAGNVTETVSKRFAVFLQQSQWGMFTIEAQLQALRDPEFALQYRSVVKEVQNSVHALVCQQYKMAGKQAPQDIEQVIVGLYSLGTGLALSLDPNSPNSSAMAAGTILARFTAALLEAAPIASSPSNAPHHATRSSNC